ncbi:hypothetical protein [Xanthomonas oryzae]|uniref:hypothetical protein n=1 Tax=Xanthomonas oryzae TaxID=347 RepID=UPI000B4219F2|nr:hypothetical protein [Xanthomonas oryzae]OWB26865.1 hypothetical protein XocBAI21_17555 [Xanthomonas oryzae pv. oryzicola]
MDLRPIDLLGGFYADDSKPWSVQDTVNWLPEVAEVRGTRTEYKLASPPGLREYMRLGDRPIRGLRNVEGTLFSVCGNDLHQISTKATSTVRGHIPGVGRVQMAHNQITGGNELLIVNGQSTGYVWNTAKNTYLRITDDGYPGARAADYSDSYLLQVEPFGRFWFHSQLANALDYNTLDRYESEASPDKIVTLVVSQFEVIVFNETTTEFFYNAGGNTGTFQNKRVLIDRGCASGDTVQKLDNSVFWLGNDGVVYRLNGYQAVPISTGPVQSAIRDNNWKQAFAFTWEDGKHKVYYLTFPDGKTWGYDVVTGVWHRRASFGLDRWRLNHLVRWNGMWIGSDFRNGRLWVLDWDYILEGSDPIVSERITGVLSANQNNLGVVLAELIFDTGQSETVPAVGPKIIGTAPDGVIGTPYPGYTYTVTAGDAPIDTVSVVSGALPPGLTLTEGGVIPPASLTSLGTFDFVLRVRDTKGLIDDHAGSITVLPTHYATLIDAPTLAYTQAPYAWTGTINTGARVTNQLIESRNGKVFVFNESNNGASVSSNAGVGWTPCTGLPSVRIVSLVYVTGKWIAVPEMGANVYVSTDGIAFSPVAFASESELINSGFAYGDTVMIGRANSASCRISLDKGVTWANMPLVSSVQVWAFAKGGNAIIACTNANLRRSVDDGATWASLGDPFGTGNLASVACGNGQFLCVSGLGTVARSLDDGVTWTVIANLPESMGSIGQGNELVFDGFNFVVACSTHIYTSTNGLVWTQRTPLSAASIAFYREDQ